MRRLLVNDALSQLGERTFWHELREWFSCEFEGGDYATLASKSSEAIEFFNPDDGYAGDDPYTLIIRNASWFPPIETSERMRTPTIALLQDIFPPGPQRDMQAAVIKSATRTVYNSAYTAAQYAAYSGYTDKNPGLVIPLPVDFDVFTPQNAMGCQQALGLPDGAVCWVGASQGVAGHIKGFDIFMVLARLNPDISFVAVFKDAIPETFPPNMRCYARLSHADLVQVIGACCVGLCTSRSESQHLAGIEMGACGLPLVVPPVGCYWKRTDMRGRVVAEGTVEAFAANLRAMLKQAHDGDEIRAYWRREFDKPVIRSKWEKLVAEVECSGRS